MSYIGNTNTTQSFIAAVDFFSGNGSTVAFTLSRPVASVAQVQATISNVPQSPGNAYTVSGNTITFTSAPPSGTNNIYVYYTSPITQVIAPGQGTVGTTQLQNGLVGNFADGTAASPSITNDGDTNTGIFFPAADTIAFAEGGTEAMRLDSGGNMGLGVTPSANSLAGSGYRNLEIGSVNGYGLFAGSYEIYMLGNAYYNSGWKYANSSKLASRYIQTDGIHAWFNAPSGTAGNTITFTQAMTLDASGRLGVGTTSPTFPICASANSGTDVAFMSGIAGGAFFGVVGSKAIVFQSNDVERARIDSSGRLLVGVTSGSSNTVRLAVDAAAATLRVIAAAATTANQFGISCELNGDPNNTSQYTFAGRGGVDGTTDRAVIRSNGGLANYSANNVNLSDRREKTNFAPAKSYLDVICAIPVQTFNYIDQNLEDDGGLTLGVVAQDVQAVAPEMVMESNWGTEEEPKMRLSIYQTDLQYALMKAIQEQQAIIQTLTDRITALENK
jgi:hypothetical protein